MSESVHEGVREWLQRISDARKRDSDFHKEGRRIREIYSGKKKDEIPFNILYSNTETLSPALYNSQPRPVVQRRFKDADPLGKVAAQAGQRVLEFSIDSNSDEYQPFDDAMNDAVMDALLPGRGATRVKYDASIVEAEGATPNVSYEMVCYESVTWDRIVIGFAKKWKRVPFISFDHFVTEEEAEELFGAEKAKKLIYAARDRSAEGDEGERKEDDEKTDEEEKVALVHEIWVKREKKVLFISPGFLGGYLKEDEDPLDLTGFYPIPEPLRFIRKANDQSVSAPYSLYENQARELNELTVRINRIVKAMKVRGVYNKAIGELGTVLKLEDGEMLGAENVSDLQDGKGLEGAIWLMPVDRLINVLQQLLVAREAAKAVIYEITAIADIVRGASKASETLGAQKIKEHWVTLRLKRMQKDVQRYARDLLRLTLEIAAKKFSPDTFARMTGMQLPSEKEKKIAQMAAQMAEQSQQPPDPKMVEMLQSPTWEEVLSVLQDDLIRQYKIDIETNSTLDLEATEDQKNIAEVLNAISQFLHGVAPLVEKGSMPFEVAQAMLLAIVRRYRFGTEIEDHIKAMKAPQQDDGGVAKAEVALEKQKAEMDLQKRTMAEEKKLLEKQVKLDIEEFQLKLEKEMFKAEREFAKQQDAMAQQKLANEAELREQRVLGKVEVANAKTETRVKGMVSSAEAANKQQALAGKQQVGMGKFLTQQGQVLQQILRQVQALAEKVTEIEKEMDTPIVLNVVRGSDGKAQQLAWAGKES